VPAEQNQEFEFVLKPDKKLYISLTDFSRYLKTLNCFNNFYRYLINLSSHNMLYWLLIISLQLE
ncbi:uncharacterized protein METZ01_LOCUS64660, partial [marine metagenome]